jgi:hypothetical protein
MRRAVTYVAGWALTAALLPGCGAGSDTPRNELLPGNTLVIASSRGTTTGHVRLESDHIQEGQNAFLVEFDPASTELVTASALMPVHGHGMAPPSVSRTSTGYRVYDMIFSMAGLWDVFLDVRVGTASDRIEFTVDVP